MAEAVTGRVRVLVVDDDELAVAVIASVLEAASMQAFTMLSPIGATRAISEHDVHVVVVDVNMPTLRGDRIVALLQGWERTKTLPVILVSGSSDTLAQVKGALPGVETLSKDRLAKDLVPLVQRLVAGRRTSVDRNPSSTSNALGQAFQGACLELVRWSDRRRDRPMTAAESAELARKLGERADEASLLGYGMVAAACTRLQSALLSRSGREPDPLERAAERRTLDALRDFAEDPAANEARAFGEAQRSSSVEGRER